MQLLQSGEKTFSSFKEAVERVRRHEAARLTGGVATISAMSFMPVPNRASVRQLQSPKRQQRQQSRQQQGSRQQPHQQEIQRGNNQRKLGPHCTYDRCDKPVGHWEPTCLQKARDMRSRRENNHVSKRDRSTSPRGNSRRFRRHHRDDDDEDEDDAKDDRRSQVSSTRGNDN